MSTIPPVQIWDLKLSDNHNICSYCIDRDNFIYVLYMIDTYPHISKIDEKGMIMWTYQVERSELTDRSEWNGTELAIDYFGNVFYLCQNILYRIDVQNKITVPINLEPKVGYKFLSVTVDDKKQTYIVTATDDCLHGFDNKYQHLWQNNDLVGNIVTIKCYNNGVAVVTSLLDDNENIITLTVYNYDGTLQWIYREPYIGQIAIYPEIVIDDQAQIHMLYVTECVNVIKFDHNGYTLWIYTQPCKTKIIPSISIDSQHDVYLTKENNNCLTISKIDSQGHLLWNSTKSLVQINQSLICFDQTDRLYDMFFNCDDYLHVLVSTSDGLMLYQYQVCQQGHPCIHVTTQYHILYMAYCTNQDKIDQVGDDLVITQKDNWSQRYSTIYKITDISISDDNSTVYMAYLGQCNDSSELVVINVNPQDGTILWKHTIDTYNCLCRSLCIKCNDNTLLLSYQSNTSTIIINMDLQTDIVWSRHYYSCHIAYVQPHMCLQPLIKELYLCYYHKNLTLSKLNTTTGQVVENIHNLNINTNINNYDMSLGPDQIYLSIIDDNGLNVYMYDINSKQIRTVYQLAHAHEDIYDNTHIIYAHPCVYVSYEQHKYIYLLKIDDTCTVIGQYSIKGTNSQFIIDSCSCYLVYVTSGQYFGQRVNMTKIEWSNPIECSEINIPIKTGSVLTL